MSQNVYPQLDTALAHGLDPRAFKLLAAFYDLEQQYGAGRGQPFPATRRELQRVADMTFPTITKWCRVLVHRGLILCASESTYAVPVKSVAPPKLLRSSSQIRRASGRKRGGMLKATKEARWGKAFSHSPSYTERRLCVSAALKALRVRDGGVFGKLVMGQLTKLLRDGNSLADALAVARWARQEYDERNRFLPLLDPMYLWSCSKFPRLLAASVTKPFQKKFSVISDPVAEREWNEDYQRRIRERGLVK